MSGKIKTHTIGKLRIYLKIGEKVRSKGLFRRLFPRNTYKELIEAAKQANLMNAHVFHTHTAYSQGDRIHYNRADSDNAGLTVCIELVDTRQKLEEFFESHQAMLKNKTVIYKEVEYWDAAE